MSSRMQRIGANRPVGLVWVLDKARKRLASGGQLTPREPDMTDEPGAGAPDLSRFRLKRP